MLKRDADLTPTGIAAVIKAIRDLGTEDKVTRYRVYATLRAASAEIERLREALTAIESRHPPATDYGAIIWRDELRDVQRLARAALNPEGEA